MIALLFASITASAAVPIAPSPPTPPRPPMVTTPVIMPPMRSFSNRPGVTQTIGVQVRQDGRVLWSGEMSRSSNGMASFSQQMRESRACPDEGGRFSNGQSESNGLTVTLSPDFPLMSDPAANDSVQVSVEHTRPYGDGDSCSGRQSNSTVRFTATSRLKHGQPVTLAGEAGLSVLLTLR